MASSKFQSKNTVLTKKLNNVLYELMVKTQSDMVYIDDNTTLTERLAEITNLLIQHEQTDVELKLPAPPAPPAPRPKPGTPTHLQLRPNTGQPQGCRCADA